MLSAVAKAYLVLAVLVGAFTIAYLNPLSLWRGGGGDHFGGTLLFTAATAALAFAFVTSLRPVTDSDIEAPVPADAPPPSTRRLSDPGPMAGASAFPLLTAVALVLVGVAAAMGSFAFYLAAAVLAVALGGWLAQAFSEHPLATARTRDRFRRRATSPFTYPVLAVLLGGVVAVSISRVYLTITEKAAIVVSGLVATVLFLGCLLLASGRTSGRRVTSVLAGLALVSLLGAGAASAARGERTIEHHAEAPITEAELHAEGIQYDKSQLTLHEGIVRFTFENNDPVGTYHNVGFYSEREGGRPYIAILPLDGGGNRRSALFDPKVVGMAAGGEYWFRCDFHPAMVGTVTVESGPPPDTEHGAASGDQEVEHP